MNTFKEKFRRNKIVDVFGGVIVDGQSYYDDEILKLLDKPQPIKDFKPAGDLDIGESDIYLLYTDGDAIKREMDFVGPRFLQDFIEFIQERKLERKSR